ncbi:hypothetical protein [Gimesia maris]|uniref:hypothetical protein n=1 Tax=Gimesia maris TaxID=122 RepID=UPI0030D8B1B0
MTEVNDKEKFVFEVGKILPTLCHNFVTRIVAVRDDGSYEHRGTALLCQFGSQKTFVTALHVITEIEEDSNIQSWGIGAKSEDGFVDVLRLTEIDIAVIVPRDDFTPKDDLNFWSAAQSDDNSELLPHDYLLVHGYPDSFARYTTFLPGFVAEAYTHCASIRPRESEFSAEALEVFKEQIPYYLPVPDKLMKPSQFAINYAEDTGPLKTPEGKVITDESTLKDHSQLYSDGPALPGQLKHGAFGLSGSPVWRFGAYECNWGVKNWSETHARITGIVTGWNEGNKILIATPFCEFASRVMAEGDF